MSTGPAILVVGAFEPEIAPLRRLLEGDSGLSAAVRCAAVGVGIAAAAAGTAAELVRQPAARVIFVGTFGAVNDSVAPGTPVCITNAVLASPEEIAGRAYLPSIVVRSHAADQSWIDASRDVLPEETRALASYSPLAITSDAAIAHSMASQLGAELENLEIFGVAEACIRCGVAWNALGVVTNIVGPLAHEQWKKYAPCAADRTSEILLPILRIEKERATSRL